jgi:putative SOS response-associated peptidase YedK
MCNRYLPTQRVDLNQRQLFDDLHTGEVNGPDYARSIGPRQMGPFIKPTGEIVVGQWGLIPAFAETRTHFKKPRPEDKKKEAPLSTNNVRSETMATKPSFRDAWKRNQRCLVPADVFIEPYWGPWDAPFSKTVWWAFARADSAPWMIAGLWNDWTDPETGEIVPSYTMVTMNADDHPLMSQMHRHDPKLTRDKQDRRSVVPLARESWAAWLHGTKDEAMAALRLPPVGEYRHGAEDVTLAMALPGLAS